MEYIKSIHYDVVKNDYGREKIVPSEREWAEVKRGRWIKKEECAWYWHECSECGEEPLFRHGERIFSNYCPNCGARMDGEK